MNFSMPSPARQLIVDQFLAKKNPAFNCAAEYSDEAAHKSKMFVLLADGESPLQVIEKVTSGQVKNVVQNSYWPMQEKMSTLFSLAKEPMLFLIEDFYVLDGAAKFEFAFSTQTYINRFIEEVFSDIGVDIGSSRAIPVRQTIEELVINAQHDAPINSKAKPNSVGDSMLIIEKSDKLLAVSVFDEYGTLNIEPFLKKIENSLTIGTGEAINFGQGGAGLGGSLIYRNCDTLILSCNPDRKTRVTSVLPYNMNEDKLDYIQKSILVLT